MLAQLDWSVDLVEVAYMAAATLFVLGLANLGKVKTAARGNRIAGWGMAIAIGATVYLLQSGGQWEASSWLEAVPSALFGSAVGWFLAMRVPMTAMPEFVAFFNGLGGAASMCVALAEVPKVAELDANLITANETLADFGGTDYAIAVALSILIGAVTFSGSMVAYAKLAGKTNKSRVGPLGHTSANMGFALAVAAVAVWAEFVADSPTMLYVANALLALLALVWGVSLTLPIGGADMPVAIALLNSYSGLAGMTTGFVLRNNLLIVAGTLVGASGIILTQIMCKAMNRSLKNVLLGVLGVTDVAGDQGYSKVKSSSAEELAPILAAARSVIVVPGYGLAVAQAQHKARELAEILADKGCEVRYAIHPVAGRMPGHMNILLAEADVPYELLYELDRINGDFKHTDVVLVLGANDVCNPIAREPNSPIAGMPVLHVWESQTVIVVKRSLSAGYAGIKNPLFERDNTLMYFADAKQAVEDLIGEVKAQ